LRNGVEGTNGYLKDPTNMNLESAGTRRVRGIAAVSFLVGFRLAALNLHKHVHWRHAYPADPDMPPTASPPPQDSTAHQLDARSKLRPRQP
jgi:hypothetical protein